MAFWRHLEVQDLADAIGNFWAVSLARAPISLEVSPYLYEPPAEPTLRALLRSHLDLEHLAADPARRAKPKLLLGATDVLAGDRVIFEGETLTYDDVVASAAVPPLFQAVPAEGPLLGQPVRDQSAGARADQPRTPRRDLGRADRPQRRQGRAAQHAEIVDRRNELPATSPWAGALLRRHDQPAAQRHDALATTYKRIRLRIVQLEADGLDYPSKLDRSAFIEAADRARQGARTGSSTALGWPRAHHRRRRRASTARLWRGRRVVSVKRGFSGRGARSPKASR
jgi:NTE family protein